MLKTVAMKKSILMIALLVMVGLCYAQDDDFSFPTDRPGNVWGTAVLPHHKISWENGFSYEHSDGARTITTPSTIIRYGLFKNVELRIGTDFQLSKENPSENMAFGVAPLNIGTKIQCFEGRGAIPAVSVLVQLQSHYIGSKDLLPSHVAPSMYLIFENGINDWFTICYNAGLEMDGETPTPTTFLGLALWFSLSDKWSAFVESYNYLHPEGNQFKSELGFTFSPIPRLQLDLEADLDFQKLPGEFFRLGCGIAWMIN